MFESQEYFIKFNGDLLREGRLILSEHPQGFCVEVDIVLCESRKIWHHVDTLYKIDNGPDAISFGRQRLYDYLASPKA